MTHIASCTHTVSLKDLLDQPYIHWPTRRSTSTQPAAASTVWRSASGENQRVEEGQRSKELVSSVRGYIDVCTRAANSSSESARGSLSGRRVSRWPRWDTCSPARR